MEEIKNLIKNGLIECLREFNEVKYHSVIISYFHLEITYKECQPLINEIKGFNKLNIKYIILSTIESTFLKNDMKGALENAQSLAYKDIGHLIN